jgi:predicted ATPase
LHAALDDVCAGQKRIVLVAGEPGIGKTRLAQELAALAGERRMRTLWGRCWESGDGGAFWPWVQIIREYLRTQRTASLRRLMGAGAAAIAQVVPQVRERLPNLPPLPDLPAEQARFRLFDALATFLAKAAARQPLALIVDDLYRADQLSLLFLQFLAREVRIARLFVLGTYRDVDLQREPALATMLGEVARDAREIELPQLAAGEVAALIECTSGVRPTAELAAAVCERTDGNPFYVTEVVRLLSADSVTGLTAEAVRSVRVPVGVQQTIRSRTDQLSAACSRLLHAAAVIGREFDVDVLGAVYGATPGGSTNVQLLRLLDEARSARMVDLVPGSAMLLRFSHALIRDSLYEDLQVADRTELHGLVARAIEQRAGQADDGQTALLAHHYFQSIPAGTAEQAVTYATKAGDRAVGMLAYEDAARHYAMALQALEACRKDTVASSVLKKTRNPSTKLRVSGRRSLKSGRGTAHAEPFDCAQDMPVEARGRVSQRSANEALDAQRCDLLIVLAQAQVNAGARSAANEAVTRAATLARRLGDGERLARAALAPFGEWSPDIDEPIAALLNEALERLASNDSPLRARVLSRLASASYYGGPPERRQALSSEAVAMADRLGAPETLAFALGNAHYSLQGPDYLHERLGASSRMLALAEAANSWERMVEAHSCRFLDLLQFGDIAAADIALHHCCRIAEALRQPFWLHRATVMRSTRALMEGRFERADQLAQEALDIGHRAQSAMAMLTYASHLWTLHRDRGTLGELEDAVRAYADQYATVPATHAALTLLYCEIGRDTEARGLFEQLAARDFADVPRDTNWLNTIDMLSQVCTHLGDVPRAEQLYQHLVPFAHQVSVVAFASACHGAVARSLGLLATTLRRWEDAARHFENAVAINTRLGTLPYLARTQQQYAEMLLSAREIPSPALPAAKGEGEGARVGARAGLGDEDVVTKALGLLDQATTLYEQLGMQSHVQKALQVRAQIHRATSEPISVPLTRAKPPLASNLHRVGKHWEVEWLGQTVRLKHGIALYYIAELLRHPGKRFNNFDLTEVRGRNPARASAGQEPAKSTSWVLSDNYISPSTTNRPPHS